MPCAGSMSGWSGIPGCVSLLFHPRGHRAELEPELYIGVLQYKVQLTQPAGHYLIGSVTGANISSNTKKSLSRKLRLDNSSNPSTHEAVCWVAQGGVIDCLTDLNTWLTMLPYDETKIGCLAVLGLRSTNEILRVCNLCPKSETFKVSEPDA